MPAISSGVRGGALFRGWNPACQYHLRPKRSRRMPPDSGRIESRSGKQLGIEPKGLWCPFIDRVSADLGCLDGRVSCALRSPHLEESGLDCHARSRICCGPAHLPGTSAGGDPMETARNRAPHRTPARVFVRPLSPPPEFSLSSRQLLGAPPGPRIAIPGPHPEDGYPRGTNLVDLFYLATSPITSPITDRGHADSRGVAGFD